jgi:hypothetical protein
MKKYQEIKRNLVDDLGFATLADYKKWIDEVRPGVTPTPERIAKLSPDGLDCRDFWRVCEELYGMDPVCNVAVAPKVGTLSHAVETHMDSNRLNLQLAKSFGITSFLEEFADARLKILEVGPGFGSLKSYVETHTKHLYTAVDVFPRFPGVIETTAEGFIPAELVEVGRGGYAYVISSNVFQHLSARQRARYFRDAHTLLRVGGLFIFNLLVDTGKLAANTRDRNGVAWCDHYCQYTLVPKIGDLYEALATSFDILYVTQRYDSVFNFVCQKRK